MYAIGLNDYISIISVNMSDNQPLDQAAAALDVPSDAEIEWTKATSKNGVEYEYGVKKSDLGKLAESAIAGAKDGECSILFSSPNPSADN